jgi:hypothetical protein
MGKYIVPGFPEEVSDYIELPDIAELLCFTPMFGRISAEDLRKHGGENLRYLLDKAPIKNDRKYVSIITYTQMLYPEVASIASMVGDPEQHWHRDGNSGDVYSRNSHIHLFLSKCTALTEFNAEPFEIDLDDKDGKSFNLKLKEYEIKGKQMESNKFVTFGPHVHRRVEVKRPQFRFMFRITESDTVCPIPFDKTIRKDVTVADAKQMMTYPNVRIRLADATVTLFTKPVNGFPSPVGQNPKPEDYGLK